MITFDTYRRVMLELVAAGIRSQPVRVLADSQPAPGMLLIKHDVEDRIDRAVRLAEIEAECGHRATYYLQGRLLLAPGAPEQVRKIADLGHEVTYHYDVLDACDGDYRAATAEFDRYRALIEAASGQPIETVCPHGNPTKLRNGWRSNKDFFRSADTRARYPGMIDIVVDFPARLPQGRYISDAGFTLRVIQNVAGNDQSNESAIADGATIDWRDLKPLIRQSGGLVLSIHPHRIQTSAARLRLQRWRFKALRSGYRLTKRLPLVRKIASRFYTSTQKF